MSVSTATTQQLRSTYLRCHKLAKMIEDYALGHSAPAVSIGRFAFADIDAAVLSLQTALAAIPGAAGQGLPANMVAIAEGQALTVKDSDSNPGTVNMTAKVTAGVAQTFVLAQATAALVQDGMSMSILAKGPTTAHSGTFTVAGGTARAQLGSVTKAIVTDADSVLVNDNAGTPNAKSPGVVSVAAGLVTKVTLAA